MKTQPIHRNASVSVHPPVQHTIGEPKHSPTPPASLPSLFGLLASVKDFPESAPIRNPSDSKKSKSGPISVRFRTDFGPICPHRHKTNKLLINILRRLACLPKPWRRTDRFRSILCQIDSNPPPRSANGHPPRQERGRLRPRVPSAR